MILQGNFDEGEDQEDYEGESDGDSDASDDAAAGRGTILDQSTLAFPS